MSTLRQMGEFGLIGRLTAALGGDAAAGQVESARLGGGLLVGIGDDAAAWMQPNAVLVATTDMLVEGIHFNLDWTSWYDLGWKALAVNLSDVAAMGAAPGVALVSLGLRPDTPIADVEAFYAGMQELATVSGCTVAGGDTVSVCSDTVINVAVLGSMPAAEAGTLLRRGHGRPGYRLGVTGFLGASAGGLHALRTGVDVTVSGVGALLDAHRRPQPRLEAGAALRAAGVRCAMDVSDGLLADLGKLCATAGCGATVRADSLPVHPALRSLFPDMALGWAAGGGEDYELLFAAPHDVMERAVAALMLLGLPATDIGELVTDPDVRIVDGAGQSVTIQAPGWDHFGHA